MKKAYLVTCYGIPASPTNKRYTRVYQERVPQKRYTRVYQLRRPTEGIQEYARRGHLVFWRYLSLCSSILNCYTYHPIGIIPNACRCPSAHFPLRKKDLPGYTGRGYLVYCTVASGALPCIVIRIIPNVCIIITAVAFPDQKRYTGKG